MAPFGQGPDKENVYPSFYYSPMTPLLSLEGLVRQLDISHNEIQKELLLNTYPVLSSLGAKKQRNTYFPNYDRFVWIINETEATHRRLIIRHIFFIKNCDISPSAKWIKLTSMACLPKKSVKC